MPAECQQCGFFPAERTIILIILTVALIDAALILHKGITIGLDFFAFSVGFSVVFVALSQFYRRFRDSERIALTAHAVRALRGLSHCSARC